MEDRQIEFERTMRILVTGGCGFIGSTLVNRLAKSPNLKILNFDKLTYASDLSSIQEVVDLPNYCFVKGDICNNELFFKTLHDFNPDVVFHLAAESHVDSSINGPDHFINTNIIGTYSILESIRAWLAVGNEKSTNAFRYIHVSTDEVYGELLLDEPAFTENSPYRPSSPYSASKAASDHLASSWARTYNLPILITNCTNNYGPRQFAEKLIPRMILSAISGKPLPVFGKGENIRDWLHVEDHVEALIKIAQHGKSGSQYNIGGNCERKNIDVVNSICDVLDKSVPKVNGSYRDQIKFVTDRAGHDFRYAINSDKLNRELGWQPVYDFNCGLKATVEWYLNNEKWWEPHFKRNN